MTLLDELHKNREEILSIAGKHGIENVRVFGSVARGEESPDSDIDLLIATRYDVDPFGFCVSAARWRRLWTERLMLCLKMACRICSAMKFSPKLGRFDYEQ